MASAASSASSGLWIAEPDLNTGPTVLNKEKCKLKLVSPEYDYGLDVHFTVFTCSAACKPDKRFRELIAWYYLHCSLSEWRAYPEDKWIYIGHWWVDRSSNTWSLAKDVMVSMRTELSKSQVGYKMYEDLHPERQRDVKEVLSFFATLAEQNLRPLPGLYPKPCDKEKVIIDPHQGSDLSKVAYTYHYGDKWYGFDVLEWYSSPKHWSKAGFHDDDNIFLGVWWVKWETGGEHPVVSIRQLAEELTESHPKFDAKCAAGGWQYTRYQYYAPDRQRYVDKFLEFAKSKFGLPPISEEELLPAALDLDEDELSLAQMLAVLEETKSQQPT